MDQEPATKRIKLSEEVEELKKEVNFWKNKAEFFEAKYNDLIKAGKSDVVAEKRSENELVEIMTDSFLDVIRLSNQFPSKTFSFTSVDQSATPKHFLELPNIRKIVVLSCNESWKFFFESCRFPNLDELWLDFETYEDDDENKKKSKTILEQKYAAVFSGMQNIKHLFLQSRMPESISIHIPCEKLESAYISDCLEESRDVFFGGSKNTLKSLKIVCDEVKCRKVRKSVVDASNLIDIYQNFKSLERLTVMVHKCHDNNLKVPVNNSISTLNIFVYSKLLKKILVASPSVKNLILYQDITSELIEFIAKNMKKLEHLVVPGEFDGVLGKFEKFKETQANNEEVNTNFQIKLDDDLDFETGFHCDPQIRESQSDKCFLNNFEADKDDDDSDDNSDDD